MKTFKRDYARLSILPDAPTVIMLLLTWFEFGRHESTNGYDLRNVLARSENKIAASKPNGGSAAT